MINVPPLDIIFLSLIHRFVLLRRGRVNRWASRNKEYLKRTAHERWYRNHEANLEKCKKYHEAHREKRLAAWRAWSLKNKEHRKAYTAQWLKTSGKRKAYDVRRRAIRRQREKQAGFGNKEADALVASWKIHPEFTCAYCGQIYPIKKLHVDHIRPISKNGRHEVRNLAKACDSCNHKKRDSVVPIDCWMFPGLYEYVFGPDQVIAK